MQKFSTALNRAPTFFDNAPQPAGKSKSRFSFGLGCYAPPRWGDWRSLLKIARSDFENQTPQLLIVNF
jgi:hypothetical protein